jgi:hypothetical protein
MREGGTISVRLAIAVAMGKGWLVTFLAYAIGHFRYEHYSVSTRRQYIALISALYPKFLLDRAFQERRSIFLAMYLSLWKRRGISGFLEYFIPADHAGKGSKH